MESLLDDGRMSPRHVLDIRSIVSFGDEMNGDWFPWSGVYYGSEKRVAGAA